MDIAPGVGSSALNTPLPPLVMGDRMYFEAADLRYGREPRRSDGTPAGTDLLRDLRTETADGAFDGEAAARRGAALPDGRILFAGVQGQEKFGIELYVTDGTPGGTKLLLDINPGLVSSAPDWFARVGDLVYFSASDSNAGRELWRSDGTVEGTFRLGDLNPGTVGSSPAHLTAAGDVLYFSAQTAQHGQELWRSDGSVEGTWLIKDLRPGPASSLDLPNRNNLWFLSEAYNGRFYFMANDDGTSYRLFSTDGTAAGTQKVAPSVTMLPALRARLQPFDGYLYFIAQGTGTTEGRLWRTDGSAQGTREQPLPAGTTVRPGLLVVSGGKLYLRNEATGGSLWALPEANGTVQHLAPSANAVQEVLDVGGTLFFTAREAGSSSSFKTLWASDGTAAGTAAGTAVVLAPEAGGPLLESTTAHWLTSVGNVVYFRAFDRPDGITNDVELWRSDGTAAGTYRVEDLQPGTTSSNPASLMHVRETLYFVAGDADHGREWRRLVSLATLGDRRLTVRGRPGVTTEVKVVGQAVRLTRGGETISFALSDFSVLVLEAESPGSEFRIEGQVSGRVVAGNRPTLRLVAGAGIRLGGETTLEGLTLGAGATVDVGQYLLRLRDVEAALVREWVRRGRNDGATGTWSGTGITSSNAREDMRGLTGLAVVPAPDGVQVKYTWAGDATGDGVVDADDYWAVDSGFLRRSSVFHVGDLDYSGRVDLDDYSLIDLAFLGQSAPL